MATKRTPIRRGARLRLTPEHVELWVRLKAIVASRAQEKWEPDGRRREYLDTAGELNRALGVYPYEEWPITVTGPEAPDYMHHNPLALEGWQKAWRLRQALEAACQP